MSTTVSATTDRISLVGLSARGHHGVLPFEREEGQLFTVDVILDLGQRGTAVAAVTDSVTDAVDYSRVANGIVSIIEGEPVNLIESLADRIAERVLSFPRVVAAEVTVHKPQAPLDVAFEDVSVTIHRVADAAAGHGGAPASSQAAWAAQAEAPVAVSAQSYASPSSSASPVAAVSPAAPSYEPPAATAAAPLVSEVPDFAGSSFTGGDASAAAPPVVPTSEPPITPTPSPASPLEAPARSSFAAAAPSIPTPMPVEPSVSGGGVESTRSWAPDWATDGADSSVSSDSSWAPEAPEISEALSQSSSAAAGSHAASSALETPSTSAPTAASAGRTAGADGFVSLAADALGSVPAVTEPEPAASSYAEEAAADSSAGTLSEPTSAADDLGVQLPHEGRHVASSEEDERLVAPAVDSSADLLSGPVAFGESGSYSGAAYNQAGYAGDTAPETAGSDAAGLSFPAPGGDASSFGTTDANGFIDASSAPVSQTPAEPEPSPFAVPDEYPGTVGQEGAAPAHLESSSTQPSVSEDLSQPAGGSYAAPSAQSDFLGAASPGAAPAAP
ncbi:dihydroneopterin aldolase, partial [Actinomyces oris]